jgi:hypothetical protein
MGWQRSPGTASASVGKNAGGAKPPSPQQASTGRGRIRTCDKSPSDSTDSKTEPAKEPSKASNSPPSMDGDDLAKALAAIERLPLTDAEKAEAIRRLHSDR